MNTKTTIVLCICLYIIFVVMYFLMFRSDYNFERFINAPAEAIIKALLFACIPFIFPMVRYFWNIKKAN